VIGDASQYYGPQRGASAASAASVMAARRMHARLPSISGEFRQSVPLTRIRDIAHRNDIPQDVKQEIKHTLQNKLHRSAGE
jgi:phosphoglucan,water dikinase